MPGTVKCQRVSFSGFPTVSVRWTAYMIRMSSVRTFYIEQFGCRATQADGAAIERQLLERGFTSAAESGSADVVVVNTCTVTAAADSQARDAIRKLHSKNPAARVIVTGCYAQRAPEELATLSGVAWVVGNSHKPEIPRLIGEMTPVLRQNSAEQFVPLATIARSEPFASIDKHQPIVAFAADSLSLERGPAKILTGNILEQRD